MDEPNETAEVAPAETAEEAPATEETSSTPPPWGDDFDAQRAWDTITHLRDEVKEAKQGSQAAEEARQEALAWQILANPDEHDPDQVALAAQIAGVELEEEDDETEDDPYDQRLSQVEQALTAQQEAESDKAFDNHLDELARDAEVELSQYDRRALRATSEENGFNPEATEAAFKQFVEERKAYEKAVIDGYVKGKRNVPAVPPPGSNATEQPDLDDRQKRVAWMTERFQTSRQE